MLKWTDYHATLNMQIDPTYFYVLDNYFQKKYQKFEKSQHAHSNIWMHLYHAICADMITLFKSKIVASYKDPQQY